MNRRHGEQINKTPVYIAAFILITLISMCYKLFLTGTFDGFVKGEQTGQITVMTDMESAIETTYITETVITQPLIDVYICGAVYYPGVYEIEAGAIINDVVTLAGGLTDNADLSRVNLVYIIDSNLSIYIPEKGEECDASPIFRTEDQVVWGDGDSGAVQQEGGLVNINTASLEQLMSLPGIGQVTANAILEYREQNHFERVEDLMNVTGIGEAKFNGIRDLICV